MPHRRHLVHAAIHVGLGLQIACATRTDSVTETPAESRIVGIWATIKGTQRGFENGHEVTRRADEYLVLQWLIRWDGSFVLNSTMTGMFGRMDRLRRKGDRLEVHPEGFELHPERVIEVVESRYTPTSSRMVLVSTDSNGGRETLSFDAKLRCRTLFFRHTVDDPDGTMELTAELERVDWNPPGLCTTCLEHRDEGGRCPHCRKPR